MLLWRYFPLSAFDREQIMVTQTQISTHNGFEWGVVFAGSAIACAITIVMMQFGSAIGLSADSPLMGGENLAHWSIVATGIWILWVQLLGSLSGGYVAGYLRRPTAGYTAYENELHDGIYGFCVWAISTLAVFTVFSLVAYGASYIDAISTPITEEPVLALTDREQNVALIFAFVLGSTSLLSAVAAWWAATMGGDHRANGTDFSAQLTFKSVKK